MAAEAYDLNRFAPREGERRANARRGKAQLKVAAPKRPTVPAQFARMMRTLLAAVLLVGLMCGVLYTQAGVTELQSRIAKAEAQLDEEEALYAYLTFELENMSTQRSIEQRAEELGLVKMNSNQIIYVRVEEGNRIEVKDKPMSKLFDKASAGVLSLMDHLSPQ